MKSTNLFLKGFLYFRASFYAWLELLTGSAGFYKLYFWTFLNGDAGKIYRDYVGKITVKLWKN